MNAPAPVMISASFLVAFLVDAGWWMVIAPKPGPVICDARQVIVHTREYKHQLKMCRSAV